MYVADLEADGLLDQATRVWCGVFKDVRSGRVHKFGPSQIQSMLAFMDSIDVLCMHNGIGYDLPLLKKLHNYTYTGKIVDTLLISRLQDPNRLTPVGCQGGPHSVEAWGMRFGRAKPSHEDWSQFSDEMMHRCSEDVEIQHMILGALQDESKQYGSPWIKAHALTRDVFTILQLQEEYGWQFDVPLAERYLNQLTAWIQRIDRVTEDKLPMLCVRPSKNKGEYQYYRQPFTKAGKLQHYILAWIGDDPLPIAGPFSKVEFRRVDLSKKEEVKSFLLGSGWVPQEWNHNKQGQKTSPKLSINDDFEGVQGSLGRLIAKRVVVQQRQSILTGWLSNVRPDGRISQRITGIADTSRLTHSVVVNVPGADKFFGKQMRKVFTSKPGYKIVGVDAAGCQNRMLAARVGDEAFTQTLINGKKEDKTSIHYVNQAAIKEVAGLDVSYKVCKNLNYAFMFGARDPKLAQTANVPQHYGPKIREALLGVAPGFEELVTGLTEEWRRNARKYRTDWGGVRYRDGWVKGLDGRPIFIPSEHMVLVYVLQSDEAILMQTALVMLYNWLTEKGWVHGREYGFTANVHDEIQAEVRDDLVDEYVYLATESIAQAGVALGIACPQEGSADVGDNWYETH